jgi:hypothetical protein
VTRKVAFETIRLMKIAWISCLLLSLLAWQAVTSKRNMRGTTWPLISGFRRITARSECYDRWGLAGGRSRLGGHPLSASRPHGEWREGKLFCSRRNARFASVPGFEFRRLRLLHSHPQSQRRHPERVLLLVRYLQFGRSGSGHSAAPSRLTEHHPAGASEGHPFREAPNKNVST